MTHDLELKNAYIAWIQHLVGIRQASRPEFGWLADLRYRLYQYGLKSKVLFWVWIKLKK